MHDTEWKIKKKKKLTAATNQKSEPKKVIAAFPDNDRAYWWDFAIWYEKKQTKMHKNILGVAV